MFLVMVNIVSAETVILSPSAEVVDNNLTIHAPNRYFDEDLNEWVYANITNVIQMTFNYSTGDIKYIYKNDKYYAVARLFFVVNVTNTTCNAQGWNWFDNHCYLWWSQTKQFMKNNNITYNVMISKKNEWTWEYGLNISSIPQSYSEKIMYVGLHLENVSSNLNWDDVTLKDGKVVIKNKIALGYDDLLVSGFTLKLYDKRTFLIGNVINKNNLWLDPDLTIDGSDYSTGGDLSYTNVVVNNSGVLRVNSTGWLNITATNITVDSTSKIIGNYNGSSGGTGSPSGGCAPSDGNGIGNGSKGVCASFQGDGGGGAGYGNTGGSSNYASGGISYGTQGNISAEIGSGGGGGASASVGINTGGNGGNGGALVRLNATYISIFGNITSNGNDGGTGTNNGGSCGVAGAGGGGGGSGGGIILIGDYINITNANIISMGGGGGGVSGAGSSAGGGGGAGGRVKIFYEDNFYNTSSSINVSGGIGGTSNCALNNGASGNTGTVYYNQTDLGFAYPKWYSNNTSIPNQYNAYIQSKFNITLNTTYGYINKSFIEINLTTPTNYSMANTTYGGSTYNYSKILPAGSYYWKVYMNNSNGRWNSTPMWNFTIPKNTSLSPLLSITPNTSVDTLDYVTAICTLDAPEPLTLILFRNGADVSNTENSTLTLLPTGINNYVCMVLSSNNFTSNSTTYSLEVSTYTAPSGGGGGGVAFIERIKPAECGDGICEIGEDIIVCPQDCKITFEKAWFAQLTFAALGVTVAGIVYYDLVYKKYKKKKPSYKLGV